MLILMGNSRVCPFQSTTFEFCQDESDNTTKKEKEPNRTTWEKMTKIKSIVLFYFEMEIELQPKHTQTHTHIKK